MSLEHELDPVRIERLREIRAGAHKGQTPSWLRCAIVDVIDMLDEMVARRALERDAIDVIRDLVAQKTASDK